MTAEHLKIWQAIMSALRKKHPQTNADGSVNPECWDVRKVPSQNKWLITMRTTPKMSAEVAELIHEALITSGVDLPAPANWVTAGVEITGVVAPQDE